MRWVLIQFEALCTFAISSWFRKILGGLFFLSVNCVKLMFADRINAARGQVTSFLVCDFISPTNIRQISRLIFTTFHYKIACFFFLFLCSNRQVTFLSPAIESHRNIFQLCVHCLASFTCYSIIWQKCLSFFYQIDMTTMTSDKYCAPPEAELNAFGITCVLCVDWLLCTVLCGTQERTKFFAITTLFVRSFKNDNRWRFTEFSCSTLSTNDKPPIFFLSSNLWWKIKHFSTVLVSDKQPKKNINSCKKPLESVVS